ncbi:hypothetical protein FTUN_6184 [Frigoriglobus tundricola]|uniref:Uncharacterized protein n=1 Tax=Frigoriglobus tundricola TaxID=2774151 RepID=A0A6M5YX72_9BACT|nr:hypothetical protein FTUN_6184 [Frigoriglobus tundricola]
MSRTLSIGYRDETESPYKPIEVNAPYFLFGTQGPSMEFWNLPRLRAVGLTRLTELGVTDPVYFIGT